MMVAIPPVRVTPPAVSIMTLAEAKAFARIDASEDDATMLALIEAATAYLDGLNGNLRRCLINQAWRQDFTGWADRLQLPFPDVSSISSVTYRDANGASQTVNAADYMLVSDVLGGGVRFKADPAIIWPELSANHEAPVSVTFVAGFGPAASDVPAAIRVAAQMHVAWAYENRSGDGHAMPVAIDNLVSPFRVVRL